MQEKRMRFRISTRHLSIFAACIAAAFLSGCATTSASIAVEQESGTADWYMRVVDDEESIEKRIATYFKQQYDVEAEYLFAAEDDLYLQYVLSSANGDYPDILVYIDSQPSATTEVNGEQKVIERRVTVSAFYILPDEFKTDEVRASLLEKINLWHMGRWVPQRIYLDGDGDIVMESNFNIPGDSYPVHVEIVGDQILRMNSAWQEFYSDLSDVFESAVMAAGRQIAFNRKNDNLKNSL
jgi:hypothetical protein